MSQQNIDALIKDVANQTNVSEDGVREVMRALGLDRALAKASNITEIPTSVDGLVIGVKIAEHVVMK